MVGGTLLGVYAPDVRNALNTTQVANVSMPVFIGLMLMLYPVFCKVKYEDLKILMSSKHNLPFISFSLVMNWIVCPLFMTGLAWLTLFDLPGYREGVILVGVARCIAMVSTALT